MSGEGGRVVRNTGHEGAAILGDIIDAVGDGDAAGVAAKVVIEDAASLAFPTPASSRFLVSTLIMGR